MTTSSTHEITSLLARMSSGDETAAEELMPMVYGELRRLAQRFFSGQRGHTLQPTALVHEAYIRLIRHPEKQWAGRGHFMAVAATAMRQILTDHVRRRNAEKRGRDWHRVTLDDANGGVLNRASADILDLDRALTKLGKKQPRHARIVELRVFGGMTVPEVAKVLGISPRKVNNDWRFIKAWLERELDR